MTVGEFLETLEIRRTNETFSPLDLRLEGKWDSVIDGLTLTVSVAVQYVFLSVLSVWTYFL